MRVKIFGRQLFEFKIGKKEQVALMMENEIKDSPFLPNFYKNNRNEESFGISSFVAEIDKTPKGKKKDKKEVATKKLTPKEVYTMNMLNEKCFAIKVGKEYVESQIEDFKTKLTMINGADYDMRNGVEEISSILARLQNRLKYEDHNKFYDQYAYTSTTKISELIKKHDYLKMGKIEQFIADLPREAIKEMKAYTKETKKLCDKKPLFYIIADKKDFHKTDERRDPILLAQSPFGHFWQILGAWDEEMLFLEEL
jgi:hypothetical protein